MNPFTPRSRSFDRWLASSCSLGLLFLQSLVAAGQTNWNPSFLEVVQTSNGICSLSITGNIGTRYQIFCAASLEPDAQWIALTNVTLATSPLLFEDPTLADSPRKFYRAIYNPNPDMLAWIMPGTFVMGSPTNRNPIPAVTASTRKVRNPVPKDAYDAAEIILCLRRTVAQPAGVHTFQKCRTSTSVFGSCWRRFNLEQSSIDHSVAHFQAPCCPCFEARLAV